MTNFYEFLERIRVQEKDKRNTTFFGLTGGPVLGLDPGMTTGWCLLNEKKIGTPSSEWCTQGEVGTKDIAEATESLSAVLSATNPTAIVCEEYRVYHHKSKHHGGSDLPTARVIGCIQTLAAQKGLPVFFQSAHIAKTFCTDDRLKEWGFYKRGQRHARDAVRHACYFKLFGPSKKGITRVPKDGGHRVG